jgi:flagellar hook-basal body complex protein FliE
MIQSIGDVNQMFSGSKLTNLKGQHDSSVIDLNFGKLNEVSNSSDAQGSDGKTFGDFLMNSLLKVNELQKEANSAIELLATGQSQNLHDTMIKVEEAEIAFKSMNQIRMKVLDAYREVMKLQI